MTQPSPSIASGRDLDTVMRAMFERESANWWAFGLRSLLALAAGILALVRPDISGDTLARGFGAYAIADGLCASVAAVRGLRQREHWGTMFLAGAAGVVAGVAALLWNSIDASSFSSLVAAWALVVGALEIAAGMRIDRRVAGRSALLAAGALSALLGALVILMRFTEPADMARWIGGYLMTAGVVLGALSVWMRQWKRSHV